MIEIRSRSPGGGLPSLYREEFPDRPVENVEGLRAHDADTFQDVALRRAHDEGRRPGDPDFLPTTPYIDSVTFAKNILSGWIAGFRVSVSK
jgi:hypothetical protein